MSRSKRTTLAGPAVAIWIILTVPAVAEAHAVGVSAKLKEGKVVVEAYFDDDTPAVDAKITVTDLAGMMVAEGKTDAKGVWSFPPPSPGKYRVAVDAGAGHRASDTITITSAPRPTEKAPLANPDGPPQLAPSEAGTASGELVVVSEGPSRSEFTGWRRFAWAVAGVVVIGGGTWIIMRLLRARRNRPMAGGEA